MEIMAVEIRSRRRMMMIMILRRWKLVMKKENSLKP
jgi:hypothetical protein